MSSSYTKQLQDVCHRKGFLIKLLCFADKTEKYPIHIVTIPSSVGKTNVCITAGIHGDEIAGPLSILTYLTKFKPSSIPSATIHFIPLINPIGFDRNIRTDEHNNDLNRNFFERKLLLIQEKLITYMDLIRPSYVLTLHEDVDLMDFYMYAPYYPPPLIHKQLLKIAQKHFPILNDKHIYKDTNYHGIVVEHGKNKTAFEDWLIKQGIVNTVCIETPGLQPLDKRISCDMDLMDYLVFKKD